MLISQLIVSNYPIVNLTDKVSFALQLMEDYETEHLPIVSEEKYIGLISKGDLLDADESLSIATLETQYIASSVKPEEHFLSAVKIATDFSLTAIAVVTSEKILQGVITLKELLRATNLYNGTENPGGIIALEMAKVNYSFGELTRLVETNDANITQLNTIVDAETGVLTVTIKINKMEISDVISTLQRYDYTILYYFGEEAYENELKENYDLLMTYLKI
jgi:CBS domain-containing protein